MSVKTKKQQRKKSKINLPKVLQILPSLNIGGVERGTVDVAVELKKQGAVPMVVSSGGYYEILLKKHGIMHYKMPVHSKNPITLFLNIFRLKKIIDIYNIELVHARSRAPAWSSYYAAKKMGVKFVTTFHGTYNFKINLKRFYNSIMVRGDKVIAVSKHISNHIKKFYDVDNKKIEIIPRGVDISVFDPASVSQGRVDAVMKKFNLPVDKSILLLPGRITRWKGHLLLIEALNLIKEKDCVCLFVGPTSIKNKNYEQEILKLAGKYEITNRVYMFDQCNDMAALYKIAHVTISASTDPEAFGRVMAEASAMGCPVVASGHGGTLEIVQDGKTGWLFKPGDFKDLARVLDKALSCSKTKRATISKTARKWIKSKFSNDIMLENILKLYKSVYKKK
jgi:glycosyltransferase involved in cell wall biosynthesis